MKRVVPALLLFIALAGLTAVIVDLLQLRLESGDVYPPYSSLRSDPLGTMVLFESLGRTRDLAVRRDYSTAGQMPDAVGTTYLHLSASPEDWRRIQPEEFNTIDRFVREGGRLVIALRGVPAEIVHIDRTISEAEKNAEKEKQRKAEEQAAVKLVSAEERWGFQTQLVNLKQEEESNYIPAVVQNVSTMTMPATLQWYSGIVLTNLHSEWKPVYARDGQPVIAERQFGKGAVVLATDSFFLSNEAMAEARHPELLVWMIGSGSTVFFDEAHLGIVDRINIASLIYRYRLHWLVASFVLLVGLFVWKNSSSLAPVLPEIRQPSFVMGKESGEGFVNLLRRNIYRRELSKVCFSEWGRSAGIRVDNRRRAEADAAMTAAATANLKEDEIVGLYRTITEILRKRQA